MSDILIIGGGIAGISAAAQLAPQANVTLLEAESSLSYHASGRSAALFEENYGCASVKALNSASTDYHQRANGGYLSPRGFLLLGRAGEDKAFDVDLSELKTQEITVEQAREIVPILNDTITRAAYHTGAQDIDTDRMIQDFAKDMRRHGGHIKTGTKVTDIQFVRGKWQVQAGETIHYADTLINAAGPWADTIAQMAGLSPLGIQPFRRSMAQTPAPEGHDITHWPIFFGVGEAWYAKPDAGKLLISPAEEDPMEAHDAFADDMVLAMGIDRFQQHVTHEITRVQSTWAGLRSFAPDRTLVLGRDAAQPQFVWCAGQGGYGFQTAPAAAQLTADLVLGRASELPQDIQDALSPKRFST